MSDDYYCIDEFEFQNSQGNEEANEVTLQNFEDFGDDDSYAQYFEGGGPALRRKATFFNSEKSAQGACCKRIFRFFRWVFTKMYPRRMKTAWTK